MTALPPITVGVSTVLEEPPLESSPLGFPDPVAATSPAAASPIQLTMANPDYNPDQPICANCGTQVRSSCLITPKK